MVQLRSRTCDTGNVSDRFLQHMEETVEAMDEDAHVEADAVDEMVEGIIVMAEAEAEVREEL